MKLHNTLTKQVEEFKPIHEKQVSFYSCGPTVYDYPHIGNWYAFIRWDLVTRVLKSQSYKVNWVMNITDVGHLTSDADEGEDKLEAGAKRENKTAWDIAKFYTDYFVRGLSRLNITAPNELPKATDHIQQQIEIVKTLEEKGYTYQITDGIYFDTGKLDDYGKLANLDLEHLKVGARVEANPEKKSPSDFALWKFSPKDSKRDMEWDSPWGKGFPGWHLECSAMSMYYLGETIDLHAGGIDHIPVHHTNEIAQSESATGKQFVNCWIHSNFILVDGKKMAKSENNFYTLEDIEDKGFDLMAFRLMVLQSHYRTEAHFSWDNLQAAQNTLNNLRQWADLRFQCFESTNLTENYTHALNAAREALADDLNSPKALAFISGMSKRVEELGIDSAAIEKAVKTIDELLGLNLASGHDISNEEKEILKQRQQARDQKDWRTADELRDRLLKHGLEVKDKPQGQVWSRL